MEQFVFYSAAPVLCGAKPAVLLRIQNGHWQEWENRGEILCASMGLSEQHVCCSKGQNLVLIYDRLLLERVLSDKKVLEILDDYQYPVRQSSGCRTELMLTRLKERLAYSPVFPHEIGVMLGYPPDDVAAFIKDHGRDCVNCRHWKVYHDPERANEIFKRIDAAKAYAMDLLEKPVPIRTAATLLKAI
ncbi:MAG: DUF3793 family protein [Clostridiales Family XIII bacterium]|nr:DUF3793 family protein [Clostridiales Family XIII bacterium]